MKKTMWKKRLVLGIIILVVGAGIIPSIGSIVFDYYGQPNTVWVDDDLTNQDLSEGRWIIIEP